MRYRAFVMLGIALTLGLVSAYMAKGWLETQLSTKATPAMAVTRIVVARTPLVFGSRIGTENLTMTDWPANAVPQGSFTNIQEVVGPNNDRVALRSIEPNEPILVGKVSGLGGRATLSTIIGEGMRALTIRVNDVNGVAGFVLPGDKVDILLTRQIERNKEATTDVLLQNVKVLGVDQEASDRKEKPLVARAVTLEVSPDQAQKLTLGAEVGTLSLALRNVANADEATTRTITLDDLKGIKPKAEVKEDAKPVVTRVRASGGPAINILRGTEFSTVRLNRD
ncbi:MAG: Flp pilus assembly protein CpaB [Solirubrobacterales bacterium]